MDKRQQISHYIPDPVPETREKITYVTAENVITRAAGYTDKQLFAAHLMAHVVPLEADEFNKLRRLEDQTQKLSTSICLQPAIISEQYHSNVMASKVPKAADMLEFLNGRFLDLQENTWLVTHANVTTQCFLNRHMAAAMHSGGWSTSDKRTIFTAEQLGQALTPCHMLATVATVTAREQWQSDNIFCLPLKGLDAMTIISMIANIPAFMHVMTLDTGLYPHLETSAVYLRSPVAGALLSLVEHLRQNNIMRAIDALQREHGTAELCALILNRISALFQMIRHWSKTPRGSHYVRVVPNYNPVRKDCGLIYSKYQIDKQAVPLHVPIADWIKQLKQELSSQALDELQRKGLSKHSTELLALPPMFCPKKAPPPAAPAAPPAKKAGDKQDQKPPASTTTTETSSREQQQAVIDKSESQCASVCLIQFNPDSPTQTLRELPKALGQILRSSNLKLPKIANKNVCLLWLMKEGCPMQYIKRVDRRRSVLAPCGRGPPETRVHLTDFTKPKLQFLWDFLQEAQIKPLLQPTDKFKEIMQ
jgi:hypothetical protein